MLSSLTTFVYLCPKSTYLRSDHSPSPPEYQHRVTVSSHLTGLPAPTLHPFYTQWSEGCCESVKCTVLISGPCLKCYSGFHCTQRKSNLLAERSGRPCTVWPLLSSDISSLPAYFLWLQHKCFSVSGSLHVLFPLLRMLFPHLI